VVYPEVRVPVASEEVQDPHNFFVRFFSELGAVGGVLAVAWMILLWWQMSRPGEKTEVRSQKTEGGRKGLWSLVAIAVGAAF